MNDAWEQYRLAMQESRYFEAHEILEVPLAPKPWHPSAAGNLAGRGICPLVKERKSRRCASF